MILDSIPSRCLIIFIFIIITGIFRLLEGSINNVNLAKIQKLADSGNKSAKGVILLAENPNKFYNSVRVLTVLIELIMIFYSAYFTDTFTRFSPMVTRIISIMILTVFILIFGVYAPKRIADLNADKIVLSTSTLLKILYYIGLPLSSVLTWVSNIFLLLFGIKPNDTEDEVTEDEIRMMVDLGSENGTIDPDEKEMIHNIFELDDTQIGDIMTHRTDTEILWLDEKDTWQEQISTTNHSIYPVCRESVDNIIGTINTRDFYKSILAGTDILKCIRTPYFVPETIKADDLFRQMQQTKSHFAVVLDEYGGLGGIITMSDLLEEIVGTLANEYDDNEEDDITKLDDNTYIISGSCDIDLVSETLGIELPIEEYNTFAGLILSELGEIPEDGATPQIEAYGLSIKVTRIFEHRIESAKVAILEKTTNQDL